MSKVIQQIKDMETSYRNIFFFYLFLTIATFLTSNLIEPRSNGVGVFVSGWITYLIYKRKINELIVAHKFLIGLCLLIFVSSLVFEFYALNLGIFLIVSSAIYLWMLKFFQGIKNEELFNNSKLEYEVIKENKLDKKIIDVLKKSKFRRLSVIAAILTAISFYFIVSSPKTTNKSYDFHGLKLGMTKSDLIFQYGEPIKLENQDNAYAYKTKEFGIVKESCPKCNIIFGFDEKNKVAALIDLYPDDNRYPMIKSTADMHYHFGTPDLKLVYGNFNKREYYFRDTNLLLRFKNNVAVAVGQKSKVNNGVKRFEVGVINELWINEKKICPGVKCPYDSNWKLPESIETIDDLLDYK